MLPFTRPTLGEEEQRAMHEVLASGWITTGPRAAQFEQALAAYIGGGVNVRVFNSGTSALEAALLAGGVGPGDEVIVPAMSFVATANMVLRVGACPVFVDVNLSSRNIDTDAVAAALTPRTRALMPVHFAGLAAELTPLHELAEKRSMLVIEDAAQAIGSEYGNRRVGSSGNPVCFSFHPNKNITTIEGGAVACTHPQRVKRLERIRFHGIERGADGAVNVPELGGKMNLPDVNAAIGLEQLKKLEGFNRRRRELAGRYLERLPDHEALAAPAGGSGHSWHMFCVRVDFDAVGTTRVQVQERMRQADIAVGVHYPATHLFGLYRRLGYGPGDFPVAERIAAQTLTLPLFPDMADADVDRVCEVLEQVLTGAGT